LPNIEWNKSYWINDIQIFNEGLSRKHYPNEKYYGDRWGKVEKDPVLKSIKEKFILPIVNENKSVLEIGPGGGRWTKYLLNCNKLYCLDLNPQSLDYVKNRFSSQNNITYILNKGNDFPNIPKSSIDFIWSFGTFVHFDIGVIVDYLCNMINILSNNSDVVIQYSEKKKKEGQKNKSYGSNTSEVMNKMVTDLGFLVHTDEIELRPDSNLIHFSKNDKINSQMEKNDPGNIVTKSYKTILNRLPDEDGFEFFTNQLKRKNLLEKELKVLLVKSDEYKTNLENLFTNIINNR
jgi:cyclopropane fatty-acyl-phospholipid synthase-like methyltransferase